MQKKKFCIKLTKLSQKRNLATVPNCSLIIQKEKFILSTVLFSQPHKWPHKEEEVASSHNKEKENSSNRFIQEN